MNKYVMMMFIVLFEVFITTVAQSVSLSLSEDVLTGANQINPTPLGFIGEIFASIGFFFKLMFFQVENIPAIITIIVFYPLNIALFLLIISIIRGTD